MTYDDTAPRPPHVAHVTMPLSLSGSAVTNVVRDLCREHAAAGGRSTVVLSDNREVEVDHADAVRVDYRRYCPREWFTPREYARDAALGALGLRRPYGARIYVPAAEALAAVDPEWIVLHEGHYALAAAPIFRRSVPRAHIALYLHNTLSRTYLPFELWRLARRCDVVIGVSEHMTAEGQRRVGRFGVPCRTVLNGIDPGLFPPQMRPVVANRPLRVLYAGQTNPHKGVHILLEALALVRRDIEARVVGSTRHGQGETLTEYELKLRTLADASGNEVAFFPFAPRETLAEHYGWADIVVVPSLFDEPFCLVAAEAMSTGATVVLTDRGGLREAGGDAAIVFDGTAVDLASTIDALTPSELESRRRASLERAAQLSTASQYRQFAAVLAEAGDG